MRWASTVASLSLVWPWNSGSRMNTDSIDAAVLMHVVGDDLRRLLVADALAEFAQALRERAAQAVLVRAAVGRRNGVAVGLRERVGIGDPGDRPFDGAVAAVFLDGAEERVRRDHLHGALDRSRADSP